MRNIEIQSAVEVVNDLSAISAAHRVAHKVAPAVPGTKAALLIKLVASHKDERHPLDVLLLETLFRDPDLEQFLSDSPMLEQEIEETLATESVRLFGA